METHTPNSTLICHDGFLWLHPKFASHAQNPLENNSKKKICCNENLTPVPFNQV
jgi:hypothetical protein